MDTLQKAIAMLRKESATMEELQKKIYESFKTLPSIERGMTDDINPHLGDITDASLVSRIETDVNNIVNAIKEFERNVNDLKGIVASAIQPVDKTKTLQ